MDWYLRGECGVMLVHDTRSNDFRSINARLMYKLPFFPFHEQKGARETAYFESETLLDNSNSISVKQKAGKLHVISFQQCSSRFAARTVLFAIHSQILSVLFWNVVKNAYMTSGLIYIFSCTLFQRLLWKNSKMF